MPHALFKRLANRSGSFRDAAMNRQAILERLNAEAPHLKRKYGVTSLAIFGSMARGDDREGSDVDVLVTFEGKATFGNFMGLKLDLEDLFGRRVDLLTPRCLSPSMKETIDKEALLAS
jgi:predicted nucleotidyltransferase